ncbi:helix-turn-helix domain-containing protein [Shewanella sp. A32]|uniref:helix-turn-helix transcriptional regulator n=1 Tax=Shewanella sp. A32 TaxID=3031327 RepID=UPI0023B9660A|nr:helix-turn-helix domain-containing protein [Shewanella sp. A32]MDF0534694.1 helix-turn-helix domain-containing protein [Shewanella sp. A32]
MSNLKFSRDPLDIYIDNKRVMRRPEIMRLLSVSRSTLHRWIKSGIFPKPAFKQGGIALWHKQDYDDWMAQHRR